MTFGRLGWKNNFQEKLNGTPERRWRKTFITSFSKIFWGPKSSQNGDLWSELDHCILFHPYRCIWSEKSGRIIPRGSFYLWGLIWKNEVRNLSGEFWGIKWNFWGLNFFFWCLKTLPECFRPQCAKLGPTGKNGPTIWFIVFLHYKSIKMD